MRLQSIRARLTLWYMSMLTVSVLLLGGVAYSLLIYSIRHDLDVALDGTAQALTEQSLQRDRAFMPADVDAIFRRFFGFSPWDRYVERRDRLGQRDPLWSPAPASPLPLSPQARRNAMAGHSTFETVEGLGEYPVRMLTRPVIVGGQLHNLIQVGMSLESFYATRRRFLLSMAAVLPLGLLLAGGGGLLLARRALAPVEHMTEAARRISAAHLSERLQESGSGDELDRLAAVLNAMLSRLDEAFCQMRQFSADASHELQTPLTILKGEIEVALRTPRSQETYQRVLRSALEEVDRIASLVEGLLLLARADAGVLRLDQHPVDLAQLLTDVYTQTQTLAQSRGLSFTCTSVAPVVIQGDADRLRRLLINLIDNAIKYTPPGGHVTLSLQQDNMTASLCVTDTGIGIPLPEHEQIFQRFYRSSKARAYDAHGSGLGLCIAQSIAEAHGGSLHLTSTPGQGSRFTVRLPLARV